MTLDRAGEAADLQELWWWRLASLRLAGRAKAPVPKTSSFLHNALLHNKLSDSPQADELRLLGFALQGALQGLIEGGFGAVVFLLGDAALFVFHFELEEFFFQGFEQHGGGATLGTRLT